jgi:hypothetical protein
MPMSFPTYCKAIRFAAGIAMSFRGHLDAPTISIEGPKRADKLTVDALVFLGLAKGWFDETP